MNLKVLTKLDVLLAIHCGKAHFAFKQHCSAFVIAENIYYVSEKQYNSAKQQQKIY